MDCLDLAIKAQESLETFHLNYLFGPGYPLVVILGAVFIFVGKIFGSADPVIAVNLMSVVFGALGCWMFYLVIRRLLTEAGAVIGSILFMFSPILWGTSVYGMGHSPTVFFLLLAIYFLIRYQDSASFSDVRLSALAFGLMGACRLQDMVLMIIPLSVLFFFNSRDARNYWRLIQWLLWTAAVVVVFHGPYFLEGRGGSYQNQFTYYWQLGLATNLTGAFADNLLATLSYLNRNFCIGLVFAAAGWILLFLNERKWGVFAALWFLVPFFFFNSLGTNVPRFLVILIPPVILCQAFLASILMPQGKVYQYLTALVVLGLVLYSMNTVMWQLSYRHEHSAVRDYGRWFGAHTEPEAMIVTGDEGPFVHYYGKRSFMIRPACVVNCDGSERYQELLSQVDSRLQQGKPVYVTSIALLADNPGGEFDRLIHSRYHLQLQGRVFMEDWHHDCLVLRVGWVEVYRLIAKSSRE